jgi:hypothetical protein
LQITFRGCEGTIFIDASSIRDLEIVANKRTGDPRHSLFGIVNQTKTPQGGTKRFHFHERDEIIMKIHSSLCNFRSHFSTIIENKFAATSSRHRHHSSTTAMRY